ncbi:MAG: ABC transporter ATP-binding protein [Nitrospirae bacterium]|nr:ABC transporter ATP-binding protein [Nitrospirota bacterium]
MEILGAFSIAPVIDMFMLKDLKNVSRITEKFIGFFEIINIKTSHINIIIVFVSFAIFRSIFIILTRYSLLKIKYSMLHDLINKTYSSFFGTSWSFFSINNQGKMLNTFTNQMNYVADCFGTIGMMFANIIRILFLLSVPLLVSWKVTITTIGLGFLFAIPFFMLGKINYNLGKHAISISNTYVELLGESFTTAKLILGSGNQGKNIEKVSKLFRNLCRVSIQSQTLNAGTPSLYETVGWLIILIILYLSTLHLSVYIADFSVIIYAIYRVIPMIGEIVSQRNTIINFAPSYEQIMQLNKMAEMNVQKSGNILFKCLNRHIEIKGVYFNYPGQNALLSNINIHIQKNKMTALVGTSGAGKSTIIDIIMGFYEPDNGSVIINNVNLFDYNIVSFRKCIGYVPQETILFNDTVRNNLLWSKDDATENEMIEACTISNAHDFIIELPNGYDTFVGDRGVRLSGGQRQRIALARALLRKPELLILDEATSSLDSQSEFMIQQSLEKILNAMTIIAIAHRITTIKSADWIYLLDKGRVVDEGTFNNLIAKPGLFRKMSLLQGII